MGTGIWAVLGIPPTGDRGAIRRAYARRLKEIDSGADPDEFRGLRAAYENALRDAAWIEEEGGGAAMAVATVPEQDVANRAEEVAPAPVSVPLPVPAPLPMAVAAVPVAPVRAPAAGRGSGAERAQPGRGSAIVIRASIREGLLLEAARAWACSTELSFVETQAISDELAAWAIDLDVNARMLEELIETMGWRVAATERRGSPALVAVMQRQLAERWYSGLVATAGMRAWWFSRRRPHVVAARLVLQRAPGWFERLTTWAWSSRGLSYWLPGVRRHWRWIGPRLDGGRVAWCESSATDNQSMLVRGLVRAGRFYLIWSLAFTGIRAAREWILSMQ